MSLEFEQQLATPTFEYPQTSGLLDTVMVNPDVRAIIAATRSSYPGAFELMRREYPLAAQGTVAAVEGAPQNAFDTPSQGHSQAPQA